MTLDNNRKILFIGPYPPPYSGPELSMQLFLSSGLKDCYQIKFLKTNPRKSNKNKGRLDLQMSWAFLWFFSRLIFTLLFNKYELVYYPITVTQIGWVGRDAWCLFLCKLRGVRTVIHLRGSHFRLNYRSFHPLLKKLVKRALAKVDRVIVQAEQLRDQFDGLITQDKVRVLYQAINVDEYSNPNIDEYGEYNVLFLGHMTKAKGYCDLMRALPLVAMHYPEVQFQIAGTLRRGERNIFFNQLTGEKLLYEDPTVLHKQALRSAFKKNYQYLGVLKDQEKLRVLEKAAIFVLPSYSEGFSRALLEAMCMGKAVVCTPVGAHGEIVKDGVNGIIVKPGDHEQLAKEIISLLADKGKRDKIGCVNYQYVRDAFGIDIIANRLDSIFLEALGPA